MKTLEKTLLIATGNEGKLIELREMFDGFPVGLASLRDFPDVPEVIESGSTFEENARLKAIGYASSTCLTAVADDSGLEIEALGGRPGILSARYGGEGTSFDAKMAILLHELGGTGDRERRARFVCRIAVSDPNGNVVLESEGVCDGTIAAEPRGSGGFGYDPYFLVPALGQTGAELPLDIKNGLSHRGQALAALVEKLKAEWDLK